MPDNHKPESSSDSSSTSLKLKASKSDSNYDLSLQDNSDKYSYHGARMSGDGQYVLIFDQAKQHFVLHRIDSTFDMNLVASPWENDPSTLQSQYPQLAPPTTNSQADIPERKPAKATKATPSTKTTKAAPVPKVPKAAPPPKAEPKRRKSVQAKKKVPVREPTPEEDSDDGLTIEYPDAHVPQQQQYQYQATPSFQRDESEEVSDEDAEGEEYEEERNQDVDYLKLPSPSNNNAGGMSDEDIELDLEAELEQALKEEGGGDESSESEEE